MSRRHPRQRPQPLRQAAGRAGLGVALLWAVGVGGGAAAAASFDCGKAATPAEQVICGDGTLSRLDGRLAEVYTGLSGQLAGAARQRLISEQRAWLAERDRRCGIPAQGGPPALAERWQWAPCLADRYRERLDRLGAGVAAAAPPPAAALPGYIHPLCLEMALGGRATATDDRPVPVVIDGCNRGHRHVPVTGRESAEWLAVDDVSDDALGAWFAYRPLGSLGDGRRFVEIAWSGGGTGIFSEVVEVRRSAGGSGGPATITAMSVFGGGDRCNGGISGARLDGETLLVQQRATPAGLIAAGDRNLDVFRYGLYDCAICCAGSVDHRLSLDGGGGGVAQATITDTLAAEDEAADSAQACFDRLVKGRGRLPQTLTAAALAELTKAFVAACPAAEGR